MESVIDKEKQADWLRKQIEYLQSRIASTIPTNNGVYAIRNYAYLIEGYRSDLMELFKKD